MIINSKFLIFLLLFFFAPAFTYSLPYEQLRNPKKYSNSFILDTLKTLDSDTKNSIEKQLNDLEAKTSDEVFLVTVDNLNGLNIEDYAQNLFQKWKIGKKDKNNGVLIIFSKGDRKIRVHTGYGLEATLTDALTKRWTETLAIPQFKEEKYSEGLQLLSEKIASYLKGEEIAPSEIQTPSDIDYPSNSIEDEKWIRWINALIFYPFKFGFFSIVLCIFSFVCLKGAFKNLQMVTEKELTVKTPSEKLKLESYYSFKSIFQLDEKTSFTQIFKIYFFLLLILFIIFYSLFKNASFPFYQSEGFNFWLLTFVSPLIALLLQSVSASKQPSKAGKIQSAQKVTILFLRVVLFFQILLLIKQPFNTFFNFPYDETRQLDYDLFIFYSIFGPLFLWMNWKLLKTVSINRFQNYRLSCSICNQPMHFIDEKEDDIFLNPQEIAEEKAEGMDYEFWNCSLCKSTQRFEVKLSRGEDCPSCKRRSVYISILILRKATTSHTGKKEIRSECYNPQCDFKKIVEKIIPKINNRTSSSGSSSFGSSSSSSSSSGGGSSGGGGSSSSW